MSTKTLVILVAGLAGALGASSVWASASDTSSMRVAYADLDLAHDAGIDRLYSRLRQAANSVCGSADLRDLHAYAAQRACATSALDQAVAQIHSSRLSARHALGATAPSMAMRD